MAPKLHRMVWMRPALMKPLIAALVLLWAVSSPAQTFDAPDATLSVTAAATRPQQVFNPKIFWTEAGAYTLSNVLDGYTTVVHAPGYEESGFPQGSAFLLGRHPSAGRYVATMGVIELATSFAAYRLEHSPRKFLRMFGHALMMQGTYEHAEGYISNVLTQSGGSTLPESKPALAAAPLTKQRF